MAVECDGDRYHPLDRLPEDMARQAILERLGWTFVRIRGSVFFRDPDQAMAPVFARLAELGIPPEGGSSGGTSDIRNASDLRERVIRRAEELRREWVCPGADEPMGRGTEASSSKSSRDTPNSPHYGEKPERVIVHTRSDAHRLAPDTATPRAEPRVSHPPAHAHPKSAASGQGPAEQRTVAVHQSSTSGPGKDQTSLPRAVKGGSPPDSAPTWVGPFSNAKMNDPLIWRDLAHWAEREARLSPKSERFALQVSMMLRQSARFTEKQRQWAEQIFARAVEMGFGQSDQ